MSFKILIADDEARIRKLVADFVKNSGYQAVEAEDGKVALEIIAEQEVDLVILDVMMPHYDGWAVCREVRKNNPQIPIIMLTARGEESDQVFGFELGADEYVTKPFSPVVLMARVKALLRRTTSSIENGKDYEGLEIDDNRRLVFVDGDRVDLSPKEYQLLRYMASNEGIALSREQILNSVWNYDYYGDARTVDTHIKKLRLKLGDKGDYIQTVRGFGYRFEVEK